MSAQSHGSWAISGETVMNEPLSADRTCACSTPTGARPTTSPSGRSTCCDNPLLREPLRPEHVKPRLLGHWGTTPGLNLIYAHLNRAIRAARPRRRSTSPAPATAGPALVANAYLEGTYSELYPHIGRDEAGMQALFRQFSFPGGIPSHVAPETPGSIHEGGELGYALAHAFGAAFDNPDLLVACVVGDGEAETGPLATSWHGNKFLDPAHRRRRAADPAPERLQDRQPDVLARIPEPTSSSRSAAATAGTRSASTSMPATTRRGAPAVRRRARRGARRDRRDPARRARARRRAGGRAGR